MRGFLDQTRWKEALTGTLPGEKAQQMMAPTFRGSYPQTYHPIPAAVLILIYPKHGEAHVAFMKRNEYDGPHSAQVSFPGGAWEKEDGSLENTAVRETREELGIKERIDLVGSLTDLYIPVSNFRVTPFVGVLDQTPGFCPDPSEVQYVVEASLPQLMDPEILASEKIFRHGQSIDTPYYRLGKEMIWGATAMMLSEFLQLASSLQ